MTLVARLARSDSAFALAIIIPTLMGAGSSLAVAYAVASALKGFLQ